MLTSVELIDRGRKSIYGHTESHVSTDFFGTLDKHTVLFFSGKSLHVNHFSCLCTERFSILPVNNIALINSDLCSVLLSTVMCVPCYSRFLCSVTVMLIVSGTGEAYVPLSMCRYMSKIFSTLLKRFFKKESCLILLSDIKLVNPA